jgi:hypothetical protein
MEYFIGQNNEQFANVFVVEVTPEESIVPEQEEKKEEEPVEIKKEVSEEFLNLSQEIEKENV